MKNKIRIFLILTTIFAVSCDDNFKFESQPILEGNYAGTLIATKGTDTLYVQNGVQFNFTYVDLNYTDWSLEGEYKELKDVILPTEGRTIAQKNNNIVKYISTIRTRLSGTGRIVPMYIEKEESSVYVNITFNDAKPFTIVEFKQNHIGDDFVKP